MPESQLGFNMDEFVSVIRFGARHARMAGEGASNRKSAPPGKKMPAMHESLLL